MGDQPFFNWMNERYNLSQLNSDFYQRDTRIDPWP